MMAYRWLWLMILAACVIVFILQNIFPGITGEYALDSATVAQKPWTFITYMFLHGSFEHLFYNMFALALFGTLLESLIGGRRFLIAYFGAGLLAAFGSLLFYEASIGASGAIYGVLGTIAMLRPRMTVYVYFIPLPMILAVVFWAAGDIFGLFYPDTIAHSAHLAGLFFGLAYGILLRKKFSEHRNKRELVRELSSEEFRNWEDRYMRH
jgi:uncharacterized protein